MSKISKRLTLTTESLRPLSGAQLDAVVGGMAQPRANTLSDGHTIGQATSRQGGGGWGPGIGDPR